MPKKKKGKMPVADNFNDDFYYFEKPLIKRVALMELGKEDIYVVTYVLSKSQKEECNVRVKISKKGELTFCDNEIEKVVLYEIDAPKSKIKELAEQLKKYFETVLPDKIEEIASKIYKCGWIERIDKIHTNYEDNKIVYDLRRDYIGVTYKNKTSGPIFFGNIKWEAIDKFKTESTEEEDDYFYVHKTYSYKINDGEYYFDEAILNKTDKFKLFFDILSSDGNALGCFAYTVHSFFWNYNKANNLFRKEKYLKNALEIFSICIHGKSEKKVHTAANIFSNIFKLDDSSLRNIATGKQISASSIMTESKKIATLQSVPIVVSHISNIISKKDGVVRRLHKKRIEGGIHYFPLYLSENKIIADEIVNFNVDEMLFNLDDINTLRILKEEINFLLLRFIIFLSDVSSENNGDKNLRNSMDDIYKNIYSQMKKEEDLKRHTKDPIIFLFAAIYGFRVFLEHVFDLKEDALKLVNKAQDFLINAERTQSEESIVQQKGIKVLNMTNAVKKFFEFINELTQDQSKIPIWFSDAKEKEEDGDCFYLVNKDFEREFKIFYPEGNIKDLKKQLDKNGWLIKDRNQITNMRRLSKYEKGDNKNNKSCLVIKKKAYFDYINNQYIL